MVRLATLDDIPAIVRMGQQFASTPEYQRVLSISVPVVASLAARLIQTPEALVLVSEDAGTVRGMLALLLTPHPMSGELVALEVVWWIDPNARGEGVKMLRTAESWARRQGAVAVQMIAPTPRIERFYELMGFTKVEVAYQKRVA